MCCCDEVCSEKCENRMMVVLVSVLIAFCYASYWILVAIPYHFWATPLGFLNLVFFNGVVGLLVYSYYHAINTNPGYVSSSWVPVNATKEELEEAKSQAQNKDKEKKHQTTLESMDPERVRYCAACKQFKPPRSHHCRDCKKCVLRMDHHCPWVNNCVGYNNHKYFLLFLNYSSVGLSFELICMIYRLIDGIRRATRRNPGAGFAGTPFEVLDIVLFFVNFFVTLPVTIAIISLYVYQLSCIFENQTSVEDYIAKRAKRLARRYNIPWTWPYSFGWIQNVKSVLGKKVWLWFLPIPVNEGDGMSFKTRRAANGNGGNGAVDVVVHKKADEGMSKRNAAHQE